MNATEILSKRAYFSKIAIWPSAPRDIRPVAWLDNFSSGERPFAEALLDAFIFFNDDITKQLFRSAVRGVGASLNEPGSSYADSQESWRKFLDDVVVTYPTGERPNPADSGYTYARRMRKEFNLNEDRQIMAPKEALNVAATSRRPVLFVDDFVGSGNQFIETWKRPYRLADGSTQSFEDVIGVRAAGRVFYAPCLCTSLARDRLQGEASSVILSAAHLIPEEASLVSPCSTLIPEALRSDMPSVVLEASERARVPRQMVFGFADLGLGMGFGDSIPDASLGLFWYESESWRALIPRR